MNAKAATNNPTETNTKPATSEPRRRIPLIASLIGLTLWIVGQILRGQYVASELFLVTSAAEFQERTRLVGNDARFETLLDVLLILPGSVIAFAGCMMFFRRTPKPPRGLKTATLIGRGLIPLFAVANALLNGAIFLGMGRVDLNDPNHVVEPSNAIIALIGLTFTLTGFAWTASVLIIVVLTMTLTIRRISFFRR